MSMSAVTLRRSIDQFSATSIGTSTTKTQLNGGNNLNTPDSVKAVLGITPFIEPQTLTAGQAEAVLVQMDSPSIPWKPKQVLVGPVNGGLGTFGAAVHPLFREIPCFTKINTTGVKQLSAYGTALIANTSAPLAGVEIDYSLDPINPALLERFYQVASETAATLVTSTGTAAATVSGPAIQVSTGKQVSDSNFGVFGGYLEMIQAMFMPGVSTVNNALAGFMSFSSNDILSPEPITIRVNPICQGTTSPLSALSIQENIRENIHRPIKASSLIANSATFDIAPTAAGNFACGIGYTQPP